VGTATGANEIVIMKKIIVNIQERKKQYPIFIGEHILEKISELIDLKKYSNAAIITDKNIERYWLTKLKNQIHIPYSTIIIEPGEKEKNIETVKNIWSEMIQAKLDRKSLIINLGGGVIGDMGGFAASTYMRGIAFIQIPTTITASVDAMVGGKVGINFGLLKNYIGSFQQPIAVVIDVLTLKTLPQREYFEGFAEIIKHGLIADKKYFKFITSKKPQDFTNSELVEIITGSNKIKANIVQKDEKEENLRKILNFGHTIGHAIESLSLQTNTPLMHGEAIYVGMVAETKISELSALLLKQEADIIYQKLSQTGLPVTIENLLMKDILEKLTFDKKNEADQMNWTLLKRIGEAVYDQQVDEKIVIQALQTIIK